MKIINLIIIIILSETAISNNLYSQEGLYKCGDYIFSFKKFDKIWIQYDDNQQDLVYYGPYPQNPDQPDDKEVIFEFVNSGGIINHWLVFDDDTFQSGHFEYKYGTPPEYFIRIGDIRGKVYPKDNFNIIEIYGTAYPPDNKDIDKSFYIFYNNFKEAVRKRNVNFILNIIDDNFDSYDDMYSGSYGQYGQFGLRDNNIEHIWKIFESLIDIEGFYHYNETFNDFVYEIPYYNFIDFLKNDFTIYNNYEDFYIIPYPNVSVYSSDEEPFEVLGVIDYNIVKKSDIDLYYGTDKSAVISIRNGENGYIEKEKAHNFVEKGFGFRKQNGKWKLLYIYVNVM